MVTALRDVSWKRFWVPRDGYISLDAAGYLAAPEGEYGKLWNPSALTLESLVTRPCLALLGEPGIGKSSTLHAYLNAARDRCPDGEELLQFNLAFAYDLERDIAGDRQFQRWFHAQTILHLFLDSLDEHPDGGAAAVALWLLRKLERGPVDRLRLRLACRTAVWPRALDQHLPRFWNNKDAVGIYELAPLRREDVEAAAGADAASFLLEVERRHATALAIKPITLAFLLEEYRRHGTLPSGRCDLYERGCHILCEEPSETRHGAQRTGKLDAEQRLAIAARLAAVTIFSRRPLIWQGPDLGDLPPEAVLERALYGGSERTRTLEFGVGAEEVHEVLTMTGLFTARADNGLGWAHQTYAEFLAARFLRSRGLSADEMLRELTNPSTPGKVVPELYETAAWLAGMSLAFFEALLYNDPQTLLRSDFAKIGDAERETLVTTLLQMLDTKELLDDLLWDRQRCRNLNHPRLAEQLQPYITDRSKYFRARSAAISIAEACQVMAIEDSLVSVALDASDDSHIRSRAAVAAIKIGKRSTKQRLRPLALGECGPDPGNILKGYAMEALWPEDLTANELFTNLSTPQEEHYSGGAYEEFIRHHLAERLRASDLPRALRWTCTLPARHAAHNLRWFSFNDLMGIILERAWGQLDDPAIVSAFAAAARARLECHDEIFGARYDKGSSDSGFAVLMPYRSVDARAVPPVGRGAACRR